MGRKSFLSPWGIVNIFDMGLKSFLRLVNIFDMGRKSFLSPWGLVNIFDMGRKSFLSKSMGTCKYFWHGKKKF